MSNCSIVFSYVETTKDEKNKKVKNNKFITLKLKDSFDANDINSIEDLITAIDLNDENTLAAWKDLAALVSSISSTTNSFTTEMLAKWNADLYDELGDKNFRLIGTDKIANVATSIPIYNKFSEVLDRLVPNWRGLNVIVTKGNNIKGSYGYVYLRNNDEELEVIQSHRIKNYLLYKIVQAKIENGSIGLNQDVLGKVILDYENNAELTITELILLDVYKYLETNKELYEELTNSNEKLTKDQKQFIKEYKEKLKIAKLKNKLIKDELKLNLKEFKEFIKNIKNSEGKPDINELLRYYFFNLDKLNFIKVFFPNIDTIIKDALLEEGIYSTEEVNVNVIHFDLKIKNGVLKKKDIKELISLINESENLNIQSIRELLTYINNESNGYFYSLISEDDDKIILKSSGKFKLGTKQHKKSISNFAKVEKINGEYYGEGTIPMFYYRGNEVIAVVTPNGFEFHYSDMYQLSSRAFISTNKAYSEDIVKNFIDLNYNQVEIKSPTSDTNHIKFKLVDPNILDFTLKLTRGSISKGQRILVLDVHLPKPSEEAVLKLNKLLLSNNRTFKISQFKDLINSNEFFNTICNILPDSYLNMFDSKEKVQTFNYYLAYLIDLGLNIDNVSDYLDLIVEFAKKISSAKKILYECTLSGLSQCSFSFGVKVKGDFRVRNVTLELPLYENYEKPDEVKIENEKVIIKFGEDVLTYTIDDLNKLNPNIKIDSIEEVRILPKPKAKIRTVFKRIQLEAPSEINPKIDILPVMVQLKKHLEEHFGLLINLYTTQEIKQDITLNKIPNILYKKAFIYNGLICININKAKPSDFLHEFMHLILGLIRVVNPKLYSEVISKIDSAQVITRMQVDSRAESDIREELFVEEFSDYISNYIPAISSTYDNKLELLKGLFPKAVTKTFMLKSDSVTGLEDLPKMTLEDLFNSFGSYMLTEANDELKEFIHGESGQTQRKISNVIAKLVELGYIKRVIQDDGSIIYLEYSGKTVTKEIITKTGKTKNKKDFDLSETPLATYSESELRDKIKNHFLEIQRLLKEKGENIEYPKLIYSDNLEHINLFNDISHFSDVVFSDDLQSKIVAKLSTYRDHKVSTSKAAIDKMENFDVQEVTLDSHYISLYSYLNLVGENGNTFVRPFDLVGLTETRTRELAKEGKSPEAIKMILDAEQMGYIHTAKCAYDIHKAANIFFKHPEMSRTLFYHILSSVDEEGNSFETFHANSDLINSIWNALNNVKQEINKRFPGCVIIPNLLLIRDVNDSHKKLVANVDLIVVEKSGRINVLKFKASNTLYGNLGKDILERDDYHLGFIRHMLAAEGFPASDIGLYTIGLNMTKDASGELQAVTFEKLDDRLLEKNVSGMYNRLLWSSGEFSKNVNKKIEVSLADSEITIPFKDKVTELLIKAFPKVYNSIQDEEIDVDNFIKNKTRIIKSDNSDYEWMFIDYTKSKNDPDRKIYIKEKSPKESNLELRNKVKDYLNRERAARKENVNLMIRNLQKAFNGEITLAEALTNNDYASIRMCVAFSKYLTGNWEFVKDDMLSDFGIYLIQEKDSKLVDIINFTRFSGDLNEKIDLGLGDQITGTFLKNFQSGEYDKLLRASLGNVELMKVMFILSQPQVAAKLNKTFSIGQIRIINPNTGISTIADNSMIGNSFAVLRELLLKNEIDVPNGIDLIKFITPYDMFKQAVYGLVNADLMGVHLDSMYAKLESQHPVTLGEMKLELLKIELMMRENKQYSILRDTPENIASSNNPIALLYTLLWKCIWQCDGGFYLIEELSEYSGTRKNRTLLNGIRTSIPGMEIDNNHKKATVLARKAMDRITKRLTEWYHPYRNTIVAALWKSKNFGALLNGLIGNLNHLYKNMIRKDETTGKPHELMMVKDPSDPSLSAGEKAFLEDFLWQINSIRHNLTSKTDPKIAELKVNKEWYWIPLVKADESSRLLLENVINRITRSVKRLSAELKTFKETGMDDTIFTEDSKSVFNEGITNYQMFNLFTIGDYSIESRLQLLDAAEDVGYWEQNLETVLTKYMFASIRKLEFDRVLPMIKGLRILGQSYFLNTGHLDPEKTKRLADLFDTFLKDYMEVSIYNKSILNDETKYLSKFVSLVKFYASTLALGFNFVGGIRECLEGAWKTLGRILSLWYSPTKRFTKKDWLKAVGIIIVDSPDFMLRVTLLEAICLRYRIANIDMNALADRIKSNKAGFTNARSRLLFWFQTSPDYFTRMGMLLAQMIHEGVFEALGYDQNGLVYDWRKDKRFSDYAKGNGPKYNELRAEFLSRIELYNLDHGTSLTEKDGLPEPYTLAEILALKQFSNNTFGAYDHDTKMLLEKMFLGSLFFLFKTYLSATKTMYFLSPGRYNAGERKQAVDDYGNPLYWHDDGEHTYVSTEVSEQPFTLNTDSFMQGIYYSLEDAFKEFRDGGISALRDRWNQDQSFKSGLILFSYNMLVWLMLGAFISYLIKLWAEKRKQDSVGEDFSLAKMAKDEAFNIFLKSVIGSFTDFNILNSFVGNISDAEPASIAILNTFFNSTGETLFGDKSLKYWFKTNSGLYRSLQGVGDNLYLLYKESSE